MSEKNSNSEKIKNQKLVKPKKKKPEKKLAKVRKKIMMYAVIILGILLVALLVSNLTTKPEEVLEESSSLPPEVSSVPVSSVVEVVLGPYDEAEMPMLLNAQHPLPEGYVPELIDVGFGNGREQTMEVRAGTAFNAMKEAAAAEGIVLTPFSCYRDHEHQVTNYNASIQKYISQGYTREKAVEMTEQYFAVPGTSEHEAGFAVDIDTIEESFENTPAFAWLQEHATEYGFILRYEKETESTTGIAYEPWHYRYVGANHAKAITQAGITLEEYVLQYPMDATSETSNTQSTSVKSTTNAVDITTSSSENVNGTAASNAASASSENKTSSK